MAEEKRKKQQMALMVGGAVAVAAVGYWYYSSSKTSPEEEGTNFDTNEDKIEQITISGDADPVKKSDLNNSFDESKAESEDLNIPPMDTAPVEIPDETESKEAMANDTESAKDAVAEQPEESPVIVEPEPTADQLAAQKAAAEEKRRKEEEEMKQRKEEQRLQALVRKYDAIAERVGKYKTFRYKNGKLRIKVLRATNVDKKDMGKKDFSDVYVKMQVPKAKTLQSTVKKDSTNPVWNEQYELDVRDALKDRLTLTVMDKDIASMDDTIGKVELDIVDICASQDSQIVNRAFDVKGSKIGCKLYVDLAYTEEAPKKK